MLLFKKVAAVAMIVELGRIENAKEQREGAYAQAVGTFEKAPPPHFSFKVVCKKGSISSGAYGTIYKQLLSAFFCDKSKPHPKMHPIA